MNKESIIAILLGFAGGILVAFLLVTAPSKLAFLNKGKDQDSSENTSQVEGEQTTQTPIVITEPEQASFISAQEVEIRGTTTVMVDKKIIIQTENEDYVVTISEDGSFSQKVSLLEGENKTFFTVYDNNNNAVTHELVIYSSTESI